MTMRLAVHHETRYDYELAPAYSVQRLYLTPLSFIGQTVIDWTISAPGMEHALSYLDGFGNRVHVISFQSSEPRVAIVASGTVECIDRQGIVSGLTNMAPPAVFLRQTRATFPNDAIRAIATPPRHPANETLAFLHALMAGIHAGVAYEIGATHAHTTAAEAFADGRGVCQDHAHIFIGAARDAGIPSRYVTGYLVTADGLPATASHAWAEALVPELGWVGFDPANCTCPTDHYVRVAAGIDAAGVTPIRGSQRGGLAETMSVEVRVEISQQ